MCSYQPGAQAPREPLFRATQFSGAPVSLNPLGAERWRHCLLPGELSSWALGLAAPPLQNGWGWELQLDVRVAQQAAVNISQFPSYILVSECFSCHMKALASTFSVPVTSPPGKNGRNYRTFFTRDDIEMKEGKILRPKPLDMSAVRAQVGPAHSFSGPCTHPRPGGEAALGSKLYGGVGS